MIFKFDNVGDYLSAATTGPHHGKSGLSQNYDFTLTRKFSDAVALAKNGWRDGVAKAKEFSGTVINPPALHTKGEWQRRCAGGAIRVPAAIQGRPDCFLRYHQVRDTRFVTLIYTGGASSAVSAETLVHKGALTAAVIDLLEQQNIRVKVILGYANSKHHGEPAITELLVTLKEHSESLDLDRLIFWLAHPSAFRRIRFRFYETIEDETIRNAGNGNGQSLTPVSEPAEIIIPAAHIRDGNQWDNVDNAMTYVKGILKTKGIDLA